jgi:hypothetical protein
VNYPGYHEAIAELREEIWKTVSRHFPEKDVYDVTNDIIWVFSDFIADSCKRFEEKQ